jgi:arylsulfatase A-like enzyme
LLPTSDLSGTLTGFPTIGSVLTQPGFNWGAYWLGKWHLSDFDPLAGGIGGDGPVDYGFTVWSGDTLPNLPGSASEAAPNGLANEGTQGNNPYSGNAPPQTIFPGNPDPPVFRPLKFHAKDVAEYNDAYIADRFIEEFLPNIVSKNPTPNTNWFAAVSFVNPHDITFFPYAFGLSGSGNFTFPQGYTYGYNPPLISGYSNNSASNYFDYYIPALNSTLYTANPANWNVYDYPALGSYDGGAGKPDGQNIYLQYIESNVGSVGGFNFTDPSNSDTSGWQTFLNYYFWIQSCVDYQIGRVLAGINTAGFWENTLILFTADHGEYAGSHWLHGKGSSVYEESMHVPLYISHPVQRGTFDNFNDASTHDTSLVNFVCSSVDILPMLYSYILGNESWRNNTSDPVYYLKGRESIWDAVFQNQNNTTQRRNVNIGGTNYAYVLHTCDDFDAPSSNTYARHVVGMRLVDPSLNVSKFAQYSPWENIPQYNSNPPTSSGGMVVSYTRPFGNNATNSQFEFYLPTNRNEIANDYAANPSTANNYANAMYSVLGNELYSVPSTLTNVYNQAFANYWNFQALNNDGDSNDNLTTPIGPLL